MTTIPSLKALRAFEAAARTGSFAAASDELSVSAAAVGQLVRGLEDQIGRQLFHRSHRSITPTEAGLEVLPRLGNAFEELNAISRQISGSKSKARLTVSAPASIVSGWLAHRIGDFMDRFDTHDISLRSDNDPANFDLDNIDIRMSFGRFHYRTHDTIEIANDTIFAVCSPDFYEDNTPMYLGEAPLIHTDWGPSSASYSTWRDWYDVAGIEIGKQADSGLIADTSMAAIELAKSGRGMCLVQGLMLASLLENQTLVIAHQLTLPQSQPYCLTIPQRSANRPIVLQFRDWLQKACKTDIKLSQKYPVNSGA